MKITTALIVVPAFAFGLTACEVEKTQEGKMPDVDVEATGGQMPKYDVDAPDVDVGTEQRQITVPTVDVDRPADDDKAPPQQ